MTQALVWGSQAVRCAGVARLSFPCARRAAPDPTAASISKKATSSNSKQADGRYHFNSVAHDNAALSSTLTTPPPPVHAVPAQTQRVQSASELSTPHPTIVTGIQRVHKFSHDPSGAPRRGHEGDAPDEVWIGLALWRIDVDIAGHRKRADVVCTANVPLKEAAEGNPNGVSSEELAKVEGWWRNAVAGMQVKDWNLFGDEN